MFTGIIVVHLILNSLIINGHEGCVISSTVTNKDNVTVSAFTNDPVMGSCKDFLGEVNEIAKREFPAAAINITINGVNLNRI